MCDWMTELRHLRVKPAMMVLLNGTEWDQHLFNLLCLSAFPARHSNREVTSGLLKCIAILGQKVIDPRQQGL